MSEPTLAEIALHAKDLIADGWVQGRGREINGNFQVTAYCVSAALDRAGCSQWTRSAELFREAAGLSASGWITLWNDDPRRTKQDVLDAFDEMARLAKERGL